MKLHGSIPAQILLAAILGACSESSVKPPDHLADAYAEILLASNVHRGDTTTRQAILDSIAVNFGFNSQKEVLSEIHEMTLNPEALRKVLDSTQNRLQSLQEGKNEEGLK
jgi:hypothetical protein